MNLAAGVLGLADGRILLCAAVALQLTACASAPPPPVPGPAPAAAVTDASYDWHGLMLMPFGTLLKESPIALHEVLLFDDSPAAPGPGRDCFTVDGAPPRLVGATPEAYLLCFAHDRLSRIEATVHLESAAPLVVARACALWLKAPPPAAEHCDGREGDIAFSAQLSHPTDNSAESGDLAVTLSETAERGVHTAP